MKDFSGLTDAQKETIKKAQDALSKIPLIPCTTCNYCAKVCPEGIGISGSFTAMNYLTLYGSMPAAAHQEDWLVSGHGKKRASECIKMRKLRGGLPPSTSRSERSWSGSAKPSANSLGLQKPAL